MADVEPGRTSSSLGEAAEAFRKNLVGEICYALGLRRTGLMRRVLGPLLNRPASRLARILAKADVEAASSGLGGAAGLILPDLSAKVSTWRAETIPTSGPALIVSNHPGAHDSLALLSCLSRRDVKVFISDGPFTRAFPNAGRFFIYVPHDKSGRTTPLREAIADLRDGRALLIFPNGEVEPDPELIAGAGDDFANWSRSLEIMLRSVPETRLTVAIASGVLMPKFMRSWVVKIRKAAPKRQKLAEVLQISSQVLAPRSVRTHVRISFAAPVRGDELLQHEVMATVSARARKLLEEHLDHWKIAP